MGSLLFIFSFFDGAGGAAVLVLPNILLTGTAQRNVAVTSTAQQNVSLTGDRGANAL